MATTLTISGEQVSVDAPPDMPLLWALGWTVSTFIGVSVDNQFAVFGASGAITFMALSGVLLDRLRAATSPPTPPLDPAPTKVMAQ